MNRIEFYNFCHFLVQNRSQICPGLCVDTLIMGSGVETFVILLSISKEKILNSFSEASNLSN